MTQDEITQVGNKLIAAAQAEADTGEDLHHFYWELEAESRHYGGDETMPLGWVAERVKEIAAATGRPIVNEYKPI
jgi:hypothetical protein